MRMDNDIEKILFTSEDIKTAVQKLGQKLTEDYQDKNPVVVGILRGAAPFMIDLIRAMDCYMEIDFMAVSSYGDDTESSGTVKIIKDLDTDVTDRHVLIVEDIIDSGRTAQALRSYSVLGFMRYSPDVRHIKKRCADAADLGATVKIGRAHV